MVRIGDVYYDGIGVEENNESAFQWHKKAARKGHQRSQWWVGYCCEYGTGCDYDLVQAMHWYQKSAAQGHQQAIDAVERLNHNQ